MGPNETHFRKTSVIFLKTNLSISNIIWIVFLENWYMLEGKHRYTIVNKRSILQGMRDYKNIESSSFEMVGMGRSFLTRNINKTRHQNSVFKHRIFSYYLQKKDLFFVIILFLDNYSHERILHHGFRCRKCRKCFPWAFCM